jgi:hypothetical protein
VITARRKGLEDEAAAKSNLSLAVAAAAQEQEQEQRRDYDDAATDEGLSQDTATFEESLVKPTRRDVVFPLSLSS